MNRIRVHSQCGGGNHAITSIRVEANTRGFTEVGSKEGSLKDDEYISFEEVKAKLAENAERCRAVAKKTIIEVKEKMGLTPVFSI